VLGRKRPGCLDLHALRTPLDYGGLVPVAGGHSGKLATRLRQRCLHRPPGLSYVSSAVSPQRSRTANFQLASLDHVSDALISLHWLRVPERE